MIFFYTCDLRTRLIARRYEKPLVTLEDVASSGRHVYIEFEMGFVFE